MFWLITGALVIAKSLVDRSRFIMIDFKHSLKKESKDLDYEAEITYSDGNVRIFETHKYNVTDFSLYELCLFFVDNALILPS